MSQVTDPLFVDGSNPDMSNEVLREALVTAERLRVQESLARQEAQALLSGLQVLTEANSVETMFSGILAVIGEVIPFTEAAVLVEDPSGETLGVVATNHARPPNSIIHPKDLLHRVLKGEPTIVMDLLQVPEWNQLPFDHQKGRRSAVLLPIETPRTRAIFVCLDDRVGSYTRHHLELLTYFTPLAAQALQRADELAAMDSLITRLEHLALHDPLTGLANRSLFNDRLRKEVEASEMLGLPMAVINIDLDDFKVINDTMGHEVGDRLLIETSRRLQHVIRTSDLVCRLGGDEFAIIMSRIGSEEDLLRVGKKLVLELGKPLEVDGQIVRPSASVGSAFVGKPEHSIAVILKHADVALYDAKASGGGTHRLFSSEMRAELDRTQSVESELRRAVDNDELVLHYQPIVCSGSDHVVALEALVRWNHPTRGLVPPGDFIPIAERSSLIQHLGLWVLDRAVSDCAEWLTDGPRRRIAVNVAGRQVLAPDFATEVLSILERHGVAPNHLELELSEEIVVKRTAEVMLDNLHHLQRAGIELSFDDFGTGYSSIHHLRRFPGQRLKIDRGFVARMLEDRANAAVVRSIVDLAHGLDLKVVAEGVETAAQQQFLVDLGCDELQGFFFSMPLPLDEVASPRCSSRIGSVAPVD